MASEGLTAEDSTVLHFRVQRKIPAWAQALSKLEEARHLLPEGGYPVTRVYREALELGLLLMMATRGRALEKVGKKFDLFPDLPPPPFRGDPRDEAAKALVQILDGLKGAAIGILELRGWVQAERKKKKREKG